jgi:hypothetical protein
MLAMHHVKHTRRKSIATTPLRAYHTDWTCGVSIEYMYKYR